MKACNLGSINLGEFVTAQLLPSGGGSGERGRPGSPTVEWELLREAVHFATRFLDNVIDANRYPLPQIEAMCKANRKIGLGIMGFADALYKLGVGYNSEDGVAWGERFMKFINDESHAYSEKLAEERGCFPNWAGSTWDTAARRKMRNAATTTVAPTGTISIIAGCSGGIEPMFSLAFYRNVLDGQRLIEVNEISVPRPRRPASFSEELMASHRQGRHLGPY